MYFWKTTHKLCRRRSFGEGSEQEDLTTSSEEKSMGLIKMQIPVKQSLTQALEVCRTREAGKLFQWHISLETSPSSSS